MNPAARPRPGRGFLSPKGGDSNETEFIAIVKVADTGRVTAEPPHLPSYDELRSKVGRTDPRSSERWVVSCYGYEASAPAQRDAWARRVSERARRDELVLVVVDLHDVNWQEAALLTPDEVRERDQILGSSRDTTG